MDREIIFLRFADAVTWLFLIVVVTLFFVFCAVVNRRIRNLERVVRGYITDRDSRSRKDGNK